jgi:hypothetical protein
MTLSLKSVAAPSHLAYGSSDKTEVISRGRSLLRGLLRACGIGCTIDVQYLASDTW